MKQKREYNPNKPKACVKKKIIGSEQCFNCPYHAAHTICTTKKGQRFFVFCKPTED